MRILVFRLQRNSAIFELSFVANLKYDEKFSPRIRLGLYPEQSFISDKQALMKKSQSFPWENPFYVPSRRAFISKMTTKTLNWYAITEQR